MRYAAQTTVSSEKSRAEIEKTLSRYGASGFMYGWQGTVAIVGFAMNNRMIRFSLPMPDPNEREFTHTESRGSRRSPEDAQKVWELAGRQRWRALALAVKAKLEAVESQITTFEDEFMAHIVLPNKKTVGEVMRDQIAIAYTDNKMPPLLGFN